MEQAVETLELRDKDLFLATEFLFKEKKIA